MTKKERVMAAIRHMETDRVPRGELHIDGVLANRLLHRDYPLTYECFEREREVRNLLGMDLVNVGEWPQWKIGESKDGKKLVQTVYGQVYQETDGKQCLYRPAVLNIEEADQYKKPDSSRVTGDIVRRFSEETDFFVFAQVGGPVTQLDEMFTMEDFMIYSLTHTDEMYEIAEKVIEYEVEKAKIFLDSGADGIVVGDDVAFNSGVFLPPHIMESNVYPFWHKLVREIKAYKQVPVFLHSDGNINSVLDEVVKAGFDGIQSLQPSAGMNIEHVKQKYGDRLCLWGNIDLNYVLCFGSTDEVEKTVRETIQTAGKNGGYILSTCNTMISSIPDENIYAMMKASEIYREER